MNIGDLLLLGLVNSAVYSLLAISFGIVWTSTRIFHIAFAGNYLCCGYLFCYLVTQGQLSLGSAAFATVAFGALAGFVIEASIYRPLLARGALPTTIFVASLGITVVVQNLIPLGFSSELLTIGVSGNPLAGSSQAVTTLRALSLAVVVILLFEANRRWRWILIFQSSGDDSELARLVGIRVDKARSYGAAVSGAILAVAVVLFTLDIGIRPEYGMRFLLLGAVATFLGGATSPIGWILGGTILAFGQAVVGRALATDWIDIATYTSLIAVLLKFPKGLISRLRRGDEKS